jgi:hypothetical protein
MLYKQHDCTAVQSVLAYLPHRPTIFSATTMEFSRRTADSTVTVDVGAAFLRKILSSASAFVSCVRGACNSLRATVVQLELTELYVPVIIAGAQCSPISFQRSPSIARRRIGVDTFQLRQCCAVCMICRVISASPSPVGFERGSQSPDRSLTHWSIRSSDIVPDTLAVSC